MELQTRRHVLTTSLLGLLCACSELRELAHASVEKSAPLAVGVNWDRFVEQLERAASKQHDSMWNTEDYVHRVSQLLQRLRLADSSLLHWEGTYRDDHPGQPEFDDLLKRQDYQVTMVSFEAGEFIPHHDHPRMTGVLLCAVGELQATNYDLIESDPKSGACLLRRSQDAVLLPGSTSALTEHRSNIHCVRAKRFTQLIDIFTPPYDDLRINTTRWYELEQVPVDQRPNVFRARYFQLS